MKTINKDFFKNYKNSKDLIKEIEQKYPEYKEYYDKLNSDKK